MCQINITIVNRSLLKYICMNTLLCVETDFHFTFKTAEVKNYKDTLETCQHHYL